MGTESATQTARNADTKPRGRRRRQSRSKPADIERWERDYQCVQLRRAEVDWHTIVDRLGYSSTGHAYDRFMAFMREYPREDIETMRDLEIDRITKNAQALEQIIETGEKTSERIRAAEVWVKLSERRAKLGGWEKPERREVTVLSDDLVQRAIREESDRAERRALEAQRLGIEIPLELSADGVYQPVEPSD